MFQIPQNNDKSFTSNFTFAFTILLSILGFIYFLFISGLIQVPIIILVCSVALLYPLRKNTKLFSTYIFCVFAIICVWLFFELRSTIVPFVISFVIGYLFEPILANLEKKKISRWLSSLVILIIALAIITLIAIFFFPVLLEQAQSIIEQVTKYLSEIDKNSINNLSHNINRFLHSIGIKQTTINNFVESYLIPNITSLAEQLFSGLFAILTSLSSVTTHIVNIVIFPFLVFYFLRDFSKIKVKTEEIIQTINPNFNKYTSKFDSVLRSYIGWQIMAACIVATVGSIVFSIFGIPYGILIACIAGLLNPIPYFGSIFSILIGAFVALLSGGAFVYNVSIIGITLIAIHFVNAYFLEPIIAGRKVGLHPILMILAVFIFHALFGIIGMLIAVPVTAIIVFILRDIYENEKQIS